MIIHGHSKLTLKFFVFVQSIVIPVKMNIYLIKKPPYCGGFGGLLQIRTVDLFRVKEAL